MVQATATLITKRSAVLPAKMLVPPSNDKRWKIVEATMRRHGNRRDALIEVLHKVQESFGYIDADAMRFVARGLRVPLSKVYGVATFYHLFTLKPGGRHSCVVCMGTACYIKGGPQLLQAVEQKCGIRAGETTPDGAISLMVARCVGSCGQAPVVVSDGKLSANARREDILKTVDGWLKK